MKQGKRIKQGLEAECVCTRVKWVDWRRGERERAGAQEKGGQQV